MSAGTDYVQGFIAGLSGTLGWSQADLDFIVTETLEIYPADTEADATDDRKFHTLLKYKALERAMFDLAGDIDYRTDGESFNRSQAYAQVSKMYKLMYAQAFPYLPADEGQSEVDSLILSTSPYRRSEG
jgi:hypothetical protein